MGTVDGERVSRSPLKRAPSRHKHSAHYNGVAITILPLDDDVGIATPTTCDSDPVVARVCSASDLHNYRGSGACVYVKE